MWAMVTAEPKVWFRSIFRHPALISFSIAFLLILSSVVAFLYSIAHYSSTVELVSHTQTVMQKVAEVERLVASLESGRRGYSLTGDRQFLTRFDEDRERLVLIIDEMASLVDDNPKQLEVLEELRPIVEAKLENSTKSAAVEVSASKIDPLQKELTTDGYRLGQLIRSHLALMHAEEQKLLDERETQASSVGNFALIIGGCGQAAALILLVASAWLIQKKSREKDLASRVAGKHEKLLQSILQHSPSLFVLKDIRGSYQLVNKQFEKLSNRNSEQILGKTDSELWPGALAKQIREHDQQAAHQARAVTFEERYPFRAQSKTYLAVKFPLDGLDGDERSICTMATDITARHNSQKKLAAAYSRVEESLAHLAAQKDQITLIKKLGDDLQSCLDLSEAYEVLGSTMKHLFPNDRGIVGAIDNSRRLVELIASWGDVSNFKHFYEVTECISLRAGKPHRQDAAGYGLKCKHWQESAEETTICLPMIARGQTVGVLHLGLSQTSDKGVLLEDKVKLATMVSELVGLAIANLKLRDELRDLSVCDPLTGLFNRRYAQETLDRELMRAQREKSHVGVLSFDVDHFKRFNDTFGHSAGDKVLREFGSILRSMSRGSDVPCRFGGEEFLLILPGADMSVCFRRGEELREATKHLQLEDGGRQLGEVTISCGIAGSCVHGFLAGPLLNAADAALYMAKEQGRDRVVIAPSPRVAIQKEENAIDPV